MVLDGFEAVPPPPWGVIEQGALWLPALLTRLDLCQARFKKTEPALHLPLQASDFFAGS